MSWRLIGFQKVSVLLLITWIPKYICSLLLCRLFPSAFYLIFRWIFNIKTYDRLIIYDALWKIKLKNTKLLKFSLPHPTEKFRSDYIKIVPTVERSLCRRRSGSSAGRTCDPHTRVSHDHLLPVIPLFLPHPTSTIPPPFLFSSCPVNKAMRRPKAISKEKRALCA